MSIDNTEDIIDSRDVIARIDQLQVIRRPGPIPSGLLDHEDYEIDQDWLFHELSALESLARTCQQLLDGLSTHLVRDSYFMEYAQELAEDIGAIDRHVGAWPLNHIDWPAAIEELKQDYARANFDGVTYWVKL